MRTHRISKAVVSGVVVAGLASATVLAQSQDVARLGDPSPEDRIIKQAVTGFEQVVVNAVIQGGRLVQDEVRGYIPDISLRLAGEPSVSGVPVAQVGYVFDVQCPNILENQLFFLQEFAKSPELQRMGASRGTLPPDFSAGTAYGNYVRETLRDAMVDFSTPLNLTDADVLVVIARVPSGQPRQLLDDSRKLILKISGENLRLYRAGELTRDEVKARIEEQRF